jgi:hypothetical protein
MYVLSITYQVSSLLIWTRKINKLYNVKNGQPCKYVLSITCQLHNSVKEKVAQDTNIKRTVCSIIACSCKVVLDSYVFHILEYAPRFKKKLSAGHTPSAFFVFRVSQLDTYKNIRVCRSNVFSLLCNKVGYCYGLRGHT